MGGPLLALFLGGIVMRIPIGFALAAASMGVLFIMTDYPLQVGAQRIVAGITPFGLLAIPLFILAGGLMGAGGLTKRMLAFAEVLVGGMRGGLAQTTMLASLIFGGISGSSVANLSSLGRIMTPAMISRGYTREYTAAVNATAPVNDPIMPPSITMIVFGVVTGTSIGNLFFAGIVPAFIFIGLMMLVVHFTVLKQGFTDEVKAKAANPKDIGKIAKEDRPSASKAFVEAIPALIMPVIILVGIRGGFFTPTEAAAVAVVYALLVGLLYRELTFKTLIYGMTGSSNAKRSAGARSPRSATSPARSAPSSPAGTGANTRSSGPKPPTKSSTESTANVNMSHRRATSQLRVGTALGSSQPLSAHYPVGGSVARRCWWASRRSSPWSRPGAAALG